MATKLRASCNACHFAKIKCIKTQQGCQRCCASGEQCSYSPALPRVYSKRRSRKSASTASSLVDESAGRHTTSVNTSSVMATSVTQSSSPKLHNPSNPAEALNAETTAKTGIQGYSSSINGPNGFCWPYVPDGPLMANYESVSDPFDLDIWNNAGTPPCQMSAVSPSSLTTATSTASPMQQLLQFPQTQIKHGEGLHNHEPETPTFLDLQTAITYRSCKCFSGLLVAMQRISEHANVSDPALDNVLCANRAAAKHCITSLQCKYGRASTVDVSCVAVACGLLGHIVASYQAALDSFRTDLERNEMEDQGVDEEGDDEERAVPVGGLQVRLGAFTVGKSEQVICARGIVAREIEKLRVVVEGCVKDDESIRSVLLSHLVKRCANLVDEITL